jgi:ABC-2 type transport system ATP-binding protein
LIRENTAFSPKITLTVVYYGRMSAVRVTQLVKEYAALRAVDGVDLMIESGEVFALLGPNGAGKTTAVEIMEGHRERTSGEVQVLGFDPATGGRDFRERIGIVLQESAVEPELTVSEVIDVYGDVFPRRRPTGELIELVGLEEKTNARVKTLSGGQQRRLELALGLVGDPDLIFLDEPTTGFDPSARRQAWSVIENLASLGKTILLTTHYMDEAQHLADRIAVIADGSIVAEGTPDTLGGRQQAEATVRFRLPDGVSISELPVQPAASTDGKVVFSTREPTRLLNQLTSWAIGRSLELDSLSVERPTLEDVYLQLVGDDTHV